jgi:hypothetical protein
MSIDFEKWAKKYETDYESDIKKAGAEYPVFIKDSGKKIADKSPYFEKVSKLYQKRGYLKWEEFYNIGLWKTRRQRNRYESKFNKKNVESITKKAISIDEEEKKIRFLMELEGVGVPVGSAILTVIYPVQYCVIDYRAWRALKWYLKDIVFYSYENYSEFLDSYDSRTSVESYLTYLKEVRKIAEKLSMTPRKIEMALWKFDEHRGK